MYNVYEGPHAKLVYLNRKVLFETYWALDKSGKDKILLIRATIEPKAKSSNMNAPSRRKSTIHYKLNNQKVCQQMFLKTFEITYKLNVV